MFAVLYCKHTVCLRPIIFAETKLHNYAITTYSVWFNIRFPCQFSPENYLALCFCLRSFLTQTKTSSNFCSFFWLFPRPGSIKTHFLPVKLSIRCVHTFRKANPKAQAWLGFGSYVWSSRWSPGWWQPGVVERGRRCSPTLSFHHHARAHRGCSQLRVSVGMVSTVLSPCT